jgi:hypothetical protein
MMRMHPCLSGEERVGVCQCRGASPSLHKPEGWGHGLTDTRAEPLKNKTAIDPTHVMIIFSGLPIPLGLVRPKSYTTS